MNSKKKTGGFLGGIIFLIIGVVLLWYNEGRTVQTQNAIDEAKANYTDVSSLKVDTNYEGKVIATTGRIDLNEADTLYDSKFGVKINAVKLKRTVEMYQWEEDCDTNDNNVRTCKYDKVWSDSLIDSSDFDKSGYNNPEAFKYESQEFLATNVKVGDYKMPERLLKSLSYNHDMTADETASLYTIQVDNLKPVGNYLMDSANPDDVQIGDTRVSFSYATDGEVSMLGVQTGDTLKAFTGKNGKSIFVIKRGNYTGAEILNGLTKSNNMWKWILRLLGTFLVIGGIGSLFGPLQLLANKIPILGSIVGFSTGLISTVVGLAISLVVIAIAWFRFRPLLSIILIVIVVALIAFLIYKSKKNPKKEIQE